VGVRADGAGSVAATDSGYGSQEGLILTVLGVGIGLALSVAASRAFRSLLFGVTPTDRPTYLAVITVLGIVSLFACYVPARRAARTDPTAALREE
jgi:putative ABC transport system permease protein